MRPFGQNECAWALALFADGELDEIERSLGLAPSDVSLRNELALVLWKAIEGRQQAVSTPASNNAALKRLAELAGSLVTKLVADEQSPAQSEAVFLQCVVGGGPDGAEIDDLVNLLTRLASGASCAIERLGGRNAGGRPLEIERRILVARLKDIEHRFTGVCSSYTFSDIDDLYSGRLFQMLRAFEHAVARAENRDPAPDATLARFLARTKLPAPTAGNAT